MRRSQVLTIYRKEMLDTIRDRRTLISMVAVPLLAIPLLLLVMSKFVSSTEKKAGDEALTIAVRNVGRMPELLIALSQAGFKLASRDDLEAAIAKKEIAAGVEPVKSPGTGTIEVRVYSDLTRRSSDVAEGRIRAALAAFKENSMKRKLIALGQPDSVINPFTVKSVNLAPEKKMAGMFWGGMMGYCVVLLMFTGGMYPAIDMTAGEKERRTLEVVLSSPASRGAIILGKVLAATTAVLVTAVLAMLSLIVSFRFADFGAGKAAGRIPLDATNIVLVFVALVPMAVLAASMMVAIALLAKSFKEAQSYLTPLVMASIFPLLVGMLPGLQLTPALALIPLFNVCQLIKQIFLGEYSHLAFAITMASNIVYAGLACFAAARVFSKESVLFRT
ncbi:MAG TPA: ABC transporter permease [Bryobacteraceae bacterium]|nr:ABC transporter permease [Bryobacteraceae bacterium]